MFNNLTDPAIQWSDTTYNNFKNAAEIPSEYSMISCTEISSNLWLSESRSKAEVYNTLNKVVKNINTNITQSFTEQLQLMQAPYKLNEEMCLLMKLY